jgi:hypothetical protein
MNSRPTRKEWHLLWWDLKPARLRGRHCRGDSLLHAREGRHAPAVDICRGAGRPAGKSIAGLLAAAQAGEGSNRPTEREGAERSRNERCTLTAEEPGLPLRSSCSAHTLRRFLLALQSHPFAFCDGQGIGRRVQDPESLPQTTFAKGWVFSSTRLREPSGAGCIPCRPLPQLAATVKQQTTRR